MNSKAILSFLNTALGIWMLSTIFVGGIAWTFDKVVANRKAETLAAENYRKLKLELDERFYRARFITHSSDEECVKKMLATLDGDGHKFAFPEYSGRSVRSLISEMAGLADPSVRPLLKKAEKQFEEMRNKRAVDDMLLQRRAMSIANRPEGKNRDELSEKLADNRQKLCNATSNEIFSLISQTRVPRVFGDSDF